MKYIALFTAVILSISGGCRDDKANLKQTKNIIHDGIRWEGPDAVANHMAKIGLNRYLTYENHHAFIMSEAAVQRDSTLFASHVLLAILAHGERKGHHKKMANIYVANENETGKLFVKLLDFDNSNDSTYVQRRNLWTRMKEVSNDPFIHYMYTRYMEGGIDAKIAELDKLIGFSEENGFAHAGAAAHNYKGYLLNHQGDLAAGTTAIELSVKLHPEGYNPYDSRAEFYLYAGDTLNAVKWYKKTLERYPYASYAKEQLSNLE